MNHRVRGFWFLFGGLTAGTIMGSGIAKRWGSEMGSLVLSPNFTTLLAGLGGAALGGVISYFIAKQTAKEMMAREDKARRLIERSQALNCMVITMQLANRLFTMRGQLKAATAASGGTSPWQLLQANTGQINAPPSYDPTDFVPFINSKFADAVHRSLLLAERVSSLEAAHTRYGDLRTELELFLLPYSQIEGGAMKTEVPVERHVEAFYRTNTLNSLIRQMAEFSERDFADAKALLLDMDKAFKSYFGTDANFRLEFDDPQ